MKFSRRRESLGFHGFQDKPRKSGKTAVSQGDVRSSWIAVGMLLQCVPLRISADRRTMKRLIAKGFKGVAILVSGLAASGVHAQSSSYLPLPENPYALEPAAHRFMLAFAINEKCQILSEPEKLRLTVAAAQCEAKYLSRKVDKIERHFVTVEKASQDKLCSPALSAFIKKQTENAQPDYGPAPKEDYCLASSKRQSPHG